MPKLLTTKNVPKKYFGVADEIKQATPYYGILGLSESGKERAINDFKSSDLPDEDKEKFVSGLTLIWEKYPSSTKKNFRGYEELVSFYFEGIPELTEDEQIFLEEAYNTLREYRLKKDILMLQEHKNNNPKWSGSCHQDIIKISCDKWGVSQTYSNYAYNAADDPDYWYADIINTGNYFIDNFFSTVFHSIDHYYNPNSFVPYIRGRANTECQKYTNYAKSYYDQGSMRNAYTNLGYGSHFLTDVGNPLHTGEELSQCIDQGVKHKIYENYVENNWNSGHNFRSRINDNWSYYSMTNPKTSTENLAGYSNDYVSTLWDLLVNENVNIQTNSTIKQITEESLSETATYTLGMIPYIQN